MSGSRIAISVGSGFAIPQIHDQEQLFAAESRTIQEAPWKKEMAATR
jgi:hypothetical protein